MEDDERKLVKNEENETAEYGSATIQSNSAEETKELNEIYEEIGLGLAQYLYWTLVGLVSYSDYAELTLLAVILPYLRCEWGLSSTFEAAITISLFGSYGVFAMLFGKIADTYGRKTVIQWSTFLLLLAAIGGATSPNKWIFLSTRLVTGACVGINLSCIVCYGTEFAENKYRAFGVTVFVISASAGVLMVSFVAFLVLRIVGWRWFIIIVSLPAVPALILILTLPESPRFLCVSGQQDKAMQAVRFMAKLNGKQLKENIRMVCYEDEVLGSYSKILSEPHRKSTIALSVIYFNNIFLEFGFLVFIPLMFISKSCGASSTPPTHKCQLLSQRDLLKITVVSVLAIGAKIVAFASAQHIGRLMPLRVASACLLVASAGLFVCVNHMITFATVVAVAFTASFINTMVWIIIPESYPTNIRSTGIGFVNGCGKIGGVLGTACVSLLFYTNPHLLIGLFFLSCLSVFVTSIVYDKETKDVVLQET